MSSVTFGISDIQRSLKDKIIPLIESGVDVIIEDKKTHELKFKMIPIQKETVQWPDFVERAGKNSSKNCLSDALKYDRGSY